VTAPRVDFGAVEGRVSFFFVRHGESEANTRGVMQGRDSSPLTPTGRAQARQAGEWLRAKSVDCILTSPLARARDTAMEIASAVGIEAVETADELTEIDIGIFAGLTLEQARERHPGPHRAFLQQSWEGVEGAERIEALYARALAAWGLLLRRAAEGRRAVLAVTHSGFLQWIIHSTVGLAAWMPLFNAAGNCCVSHLLVENQPLEGGGRSLSANWMLVNASVIPSRR
jgi:broad specificity phosphatase PhoE